MAIQYSRSGGNRITRRGAAFILGATVVLGGGVALADGTYTYDSADRLVRSSAGTQVNDYKYDGNGNLVGSSVSGQGGTLETEYLLDESEDNVRVLGEERSNGTATLYAFGPQGLAAQQIVETGATYYPVLDGLQSVRAWVDTNGAVTGATFFDPFGGRRFSTGNFTSLMGFTGEPQFRDDSVFLRARTYLPSLGRFLQRDTFDGFLEQPQSMNRYAYVENDPLGATDPTGRFKDAGCVFQSVGGGISVGSGVLAALTAYCMGGTLLSTGGTTTPVCSIPALATVGAGVVGAVSGLAAGLIFCPGQPPIRVVTGAMNAAAAQEQNGCSRAEVFKPKRTDEARGCFDRKGLSQCYSARHSPCAGVHTHGSLEYNEVRGGRCVRVNKPKAIRCEGPFRIAGGCSGATTFCGVGGTATTGIFVQ